MLYCPQCGKQSLTSASMPTKQYRCGQCDFTFYQNAAAAVMVALCCEDEVLIAIRGREPGKGMWDLPGGFVDPDESLEQAAVRELYEELNLVVSEPCYISSNPNTYLYKEVEYKTCDAFFMVQLDSKPEITAQDDVAEVKWVKLKDVALDKFAFNSAKVAVEQLRNNLGNWGKLTNLNSG